MNDVDGIDILSYDDTIPYDDQVPAKLEGNSIESSGSLAERIGTTKVYLLSEATVPRSGKRRHSDDTNNANFDEDEDIEMEEDLPYRPNAILLQGSPIAHLPTSNIFAYATHFDAHPMALEWIDDTTCILVFPSKSVARSAYGHLTKSLTDTPSVADGTLTAKPIPVALWPPEDRINKSLGKGEGLKGSIRMRWATPEDVKERGAKNKSEFYRKYGEDAGKEPFADPDGSGLRPLSMGSADGSDGTRRKRRRRGDDDDVVERSVKARLDDDLDAFLAEDDTPSLPPSPPSKMRSDYIGTGKTLLERTSVLRAHPDRERELRHGRRWRDEPRPWDEERSWTEPNLGAGAGRDGAGRRERGRRGDAPRRTERPRKSQQDLDDELEAFLNEKD